MNQASLPVIRLTCDDERLELQVGPLSQAIRAAACIRFGKNSAKSVHLTLLYPTALTLTNDDFTVIRHYVCT